MTTFVSILLLFFLTSCTSKEKSHNNTVLEISINPKEQKLIWSLFQNWKLEQIKKGDFFANDSCNTDYYVKMDSLGRKAQSGIGFPDSSEIHYKHADINNDTKTDALIYFNPYQCDGGNGMMFVRYEILILSKNNDYYLIDNYFDKLNENKKGFYQWDSISPAKIWGTYSEFTEDDGRCCPSIQKIVNIDFDSKKMKIIKDRK